jgi:hypothetical protein
MLAGKAREGKGSKDWEKGIRRRWTCQFLVSSGMVPVTGIIENIVRSRRC